MQIIKFIFGGLNASRFGIAQRIWLYYISEGFGYSIFFPVPTDELANFFEKVLLYKKIKAEGTFYRRRLRGFPTIYRSKGKSANSDWDGWQGWTRRKSLQSTQPCDYSFSLRWRYRSKTGMYLINGKVVDCIQRNVLGLWISRLSFNIQGRMSAISSLEIRS